jgi:hypothetical protein
MGFGLRKVPEAKHIRLLNQKLEERGLAMRLESLCH